ncbi:FAD-binding protein [Saccharopolyspora flava]|uniref:Succinate dehydrogenase/fumarate reductase, flavoprotein subunit n=1 Tax=Saccharopolyspora flava TaxID=95161 RepID=A0A1I6V4N0_9PSEU|nr:FAD-binding protein [Saccharopolyspora flava]SFT08604.1 Succinate dehydrogenase/fumarate reductase, flavoprotein subunit [Saccharopolyspora flava]
MGGLVGVEIPDPVSVESVSAWSDEVDVVVIGAGMAGVSAALEARSTGANVLVLDAGGRLTCTSAMAGGHFYLGGGTEVQQETGWDDSPEAMADYLALMSPECDPAKIRAYADDSVEHFRWLESLGFRFNRSFYPHKAVVQPGTEGLSFTGNEKCLDVADVVKPVPRGHKVPVAGDTGGAALVVGLALDKLAEQGVEVRWETSATALVLDGDRVAGVTWKDLDGTGAIKAGAVVIAAGGFVLNREMLETHAPDLLAVESNGMALGNTYDDGLGIRMGQSVGGVADHLGEVFLTGPFYPPGEALRGIVVNKLGKRFVNEDSYHSRTSAFVFEQPDREAYLILDEATMVEPSYRFQPLVDGWDTVEEMEQALGIPAGALAATLDSYNEAAARGEDPEFRKAPEYLTPLDNGPWGAYDLTPGKCFYAGFSCGGLRVTVDGRLLREDGTTIPGAYAAGACASNIAVDGKGYASGIQLGEASYFGRRAGRTAARQD